MQAETDTLLKYFPEQPRTNSSAVAWFLFITPLLVLLSVGMFSKALAWPAAILAGAAMFLRKKRAMARPHAILEVRAGRLLVRDRRGDTVLDAPLEEVTDVSLDTKSVQKVQENLSSGMPDLRFIDSRVGPSIDNSRIEIRRGTEVLRLSENYTSSIDASEWFSRVRRFLRKNGWKPLDERGAV